MNKKLQTDLTLEVLRARERIYHINKPTPFEKVRIDGLDADIFLKREDLSAINAYKWRGAYNAISMLTDKEKQKPIIAASAGNHAQGVALAARMQGLKAKIYMPLSAPKMKQDAVRKHGGDASSDGYGSVRCRFRFFRGWTDGNGTSSSPGVGQKVCWKAQEQCHG